MPLYSTQCDDCGNRDQVWRRIADRDSLPRCKHCNGTLERIIDAPYVAPDYTESFISPATGKVISSRAQHMDDLKRSNCFLAEPGIQKDIARNKEATLEKKFAPVAAGIDQTVTNLVNRGIIAS